jgi:exodeoxyribonuclease I
MRFSSKAAVADYITEERLFCISDFYYGHPFSCIATAVGQNQRNTAEWYIYNLSVDPESLSSLSENQLATRLDQLPKPLRRLKSNSAPMLFPADEAPEFCQGRDVPLEELDRRAETLHADTSLCERLSAAFEPLKEPYPNSVHIEKQIYNGFFEDADEKLMDAFHEVEWSKRPAMLEKFRDPRLKTIGRQLIHAERPDLLDETLRRELDVAVVNRLLGRGQDIPWLTLPQAIEQLEEMLPTATGAEMKLLREHGQYLRVRYKQALKDEK